MVHMQKMDHKLYKDAMEGNMGFGTRVGNSNLNLCLTPQKNTLLHIAVEYGHENFVNEVIRMCPSLIRQANSKNDTPLHVAARAGHLDLIRLLTPVLNLNLDGGDLERQAGGGALRTVRGAGGAALRMRNLEGRNPIHEALKKGHEEVALHLLEFENGHHELACEVNTAGESLLYLAAEAGLERVVQNIINREHYSTHGPDGQNPLHIAVIMGELEVVNILLEREGSILQERGGKFITQADRFGNTALHYASAVGYSRVLKKEDVGIMQEKQKQILQLLLEAKPSLAYEPNKIGDYPLFIAIRNSFGPGVGTILEHCPDSAELVNQKGQNALHLAVLESSHGDFHSMMQFKQLINKPDYDGNTPMHLATLTNQVGIVKLLTDSGTVDLTMSNKEGFTAMDICGPQTKHSIVDILRKCGAVNGRRRWLERFPIPSERTPRLLKVIRINREFKRLGLQTLPIVTSLVATVTFAAAFTVPGGYKNDGPREGLPVFMRKAALQAFVLSDILAFCCSMAATILLVYANARSGNAFKIYWTLKTCYYISWAAIVATITAFVTALYVLTSKESLWLAVTSLVLGFVVLLFLLCYRCILSRQERKLSWTIHYRF